MQAVTALKNINQISSEINLVFEDSVRKNESCSYEFKFPDFGERKAHLLREIDDFGQEKMQKILDAVCDYDFNCELLELELEQMRKRFGYEQANMLERILINQVLCSWLKLKLFEMQEANTKDKKSGFSFLLQLRQAQVQFRSSYDALLKVKKLLPDFDCI